MRSLLILLVTLMAIPANAQTRVFRASDVDIEQDNRIQVLEIQVEDLQKVVAEFSRPIPTPDPVPNAAPEPDPVIQIPVDDSKYVRLGDLKEINGKVHRLEETASGVRWMPTVPKVEQQTTVARTTTAPTSNRYSSGELKAIAASYRGPMEAYVEPRSWAREHLQNDHGFSSSQVAGLTIHEAEVIHSMAHGGRITPFRSRSSQTFAAAPVTMPDPATLYTPPAPVAMPKTLPPPEYSSDCPNGQCPNVRTRTTTTTRYRTPFFGRRR